MIFSWKRFKKILPIVLLIVVALLISSAWNSLRTATEPIINVLHWFDNQGDSSESKDNEVEAMGDTVRVKISTKDGKDFEILAEQAKTEEERQQGLMYREALCEDCGMLFYFEEDTSGGFWMRNCKIPLDIIFVAEGGQIIDIKEDFEPCEQDPCPSYRPVEPYRYALEVNAGWTSENGVVVGDTMRGTDPL